MEDGVHTFIWKCNTVWEPENRGTAIELYFGLCPHGGGGGGLVLLV